MDILISDINKNQYTKPSEVIANKSLLKRYIDMACYQIDMFKIYEKTSGSSRQAVVCTDEESYELQFHGEFDKNQIMKARKRMVVIGMICLNMIKGKVITNIPLVSSFECLGIVA